MAPIGHFRTSQIHPYEAGRQPDELHSEGCIELLPGHNFEQALIGLENSVRIWIVFQFHHNPHWKPMVLPPRGSQTKVGVFATRSPYRPNAIGMSCVQLLRIEGLKIFVAGADILNDSPILDIKPYVAYADAFPGVEPAWLQQAEKHTVSFSERASQQLQWLEQQGVSQIRSFLLHQLEYEPTNSKKKRVQPQGEEFVIAYRTWRARFRVQEHQVEVLLFFSGYSQADLSDSSDPHLDKNLHQEFIKLFQ